MKNKKINILILLIAAFFVLYFTLKDDFTGVLNILSKTNIIIFIITIFLFLFSLLFKSLSLKLFLNEYYKDYSLKSAFSLNLIGQFLNGITPFQSGGQPFEIYLLKKEGKRITDCTNAMLKDHLSYQIALIIMASISVFINCITKIYNDRGLNILVMIGFTINIIVLISLIFVITSKKTGTKVINKILDFIFGFRFSKKFKINKEKINESLEHFYQTGKELRKNKTSLFIAIFYNMINLFILYVIPFLIFKSLKVNNITFLSSVVATSFVMLIGNFIPIPGATGGIEYGFYRFFSYYVSGAVLSGGLLLWRFVTYAFGLIAGFITLLFKKGAKKL